jgi:hypothetical protein
LLAISLDKVAHPALFRQGIRKKGIDHLTVRVKKNCTLGLCLIALFILSWGVLPAVAENVYPLSETGASSSQYAPFISVLPKRIYSHALESKASITSLLVRLPRLDPWDRLSGFFEKENGQYTIMAAGDGSAIWQEWELNAPPPFEQPHANPSSVRKKILMDIIHPVFDALDYWHLGVSHHEAEEHAAPVQLDDSFSDQGFVNLFAFSSAVLFTEKGYQYLQDQPWASDQLVEKIKQMNFFIVPSGGLLLKYNFKF